MGHSFLGICSSNFSPVPCNLVETIVPDVKIKVQIWGHCTQGLIETLGSMVIFDENQAVFDIDKYEFLYPIYAKIINFLVI